MVSSVLQVPPGHSERKYNSRRRRLSGSFQDFPPLDEHRAGEKDWDKVYVETAVMIRLVPKQYLGGSTGFGLAAGSWIT